MAVLIKASSNLKLPTAGVRSIVPVSSPALRDPRDSTLFTPIVERWRFLASVAQSADGGSRLIYFV